jgi:hypothetical protein
MKLGITRGGVLGAISAAVTDAGRARGPAAVPRPSFLHLALAGPAADARCRPTCYSSARFSQFAPAPGPAGARLPYPNLRQQSAAIATVCTSALTDTPLPGFEVVKP